MKNYLPIPDDCFEMVLAYDGRYDKSRLMPSLRIIDIRLVVTPDEYPDEKGKYYDFIENQEHCFQQQNYHFYVLKSVNYAYKEEARKMARKYKLDEKTGHIEGVTYQKGGYKKLHLTRDDKNFSNVLGCFSLVKGQEHYITIDNVRYTSEKLWIVFVGTRYCEFALHFEKYKIDYPDDRFNDPPQILFAEENGIEILDPKFLKKAKRTKTGQDLIKKMMKI